MIWMSNISGIKKQNCAKITKFHCKSSFYNPILQEGPITTGPDACDFDDQRMAEILQRYHP